MVDLTQDSLQRMIKKYEQVKEKFKAS